MKPTTHTVAKCCSSILILVFAAGLLTSRALAYNTNTVTIGIDSTKTGAVIPANFVGLSFGREFISGSGGYKRIFDPGRQTNCPQLTNLFGQIGVKHIRTICGPYDPNTPDPTPDEDDVFFNFCHTSGVTSVIYSLHCYDEPTGSPDDCISANHIYTNSSDKAVLETFALDNEPDWLGVINGGADPNIHGYAQYEAKWFQIYNDVNNYLPHWTGFSGPDTGSEWPSLGAQNTSVNGTPFTVQFASDLSPREFFQGANQHFYNNAAQPAPFWVSGTDYFVNDQVLDTNDPYGNVAYICEQNLSPSTTEPHNASTNFWMPLKPLWTMETTYHQWDVVLEAHNTNYYQYTNTGTLLKNTEPSDDLTNWVKVKDPSGPSAKQMAIFNMSPDRLNDWSALYYNALAGTNTWPLDFGGSPLPYRLTEVSAYNNGGGCYFDTTGLDSDTGNPNGQNFSTALWELEMCHWFARHGCAGVNPHSRVVDYSAPIFVDTNNDYNAEPYAYGLLAFAQSGQGTCINASGVLVTNTSNMNLTAYAVLDTTNLYLTIIDKTFKTVGAYAANVTIEKPVGFTPTAGRYMVLTSGTSGEGDATALGQATLGGAAIPTSGNWSGTWTPLTVSGGKCTVLVQPCTAVIVDLQN